LGGPEPLASNSDTTTLAKEQIVMSVIMLLVVAARHITSGTIIQVRELIAATHTGLDRATIRRALYITAVTVAAAASGAATLAIHYPHNPWAAVVLAGANAASTVRTITGLTDEIAGKLQERRNRGSS
jgi:hypothetical protein